MNRYFTIVCVLIGTLAALPAMSRILNVPDDFQTIRAGVEAAENGDTVIVAPGRYQETITFSGNNIVVASQFLLTGDEGLIAETIIDGTDGDGHSVVAIREGEADGAELAGFTITGGVTDYGGGVYCTGTSPYLHHLIIEGNHATHNGGGLYTTQNARVLCQNSTIRNNTAVLGGGGMTCYYSAVTTIEDCIISGNEADYGAGVQCSQSAELVMRGCTITENTSDGGEGAGGLWAWMNASVTLDHCSITNNTHFLVAGIRIYRTDVFCDHVLLARNQGGCCIIYESINQEHTLQLNNLTVVDNVHADHALLEFYGDGITLTNSVLMDSLSDERTIEIASEVFTSYCLFEDTARIIGGDVGMVLGEGIIEGEPGFIDRENGDYHLIPGSPCIDTGDPEAENDPDGTRRDIGAFTYSQRIAWIGGRVTDLISGDPLPWALAVISRDGASLFSRRTDEDGRWGRWLTLPEDEVAVSLSVSCARYTPFQQDFEVGNGDSLTLETGLGTGVLSAPEDTLSVGAVEGEPRTLPIEIRNTGNAPLRWTSSWHGLGSMANVPGEVVRSVQLLPLMDDDRISGVAFDGENYYLAGANGQDSSMIYVLDRNFEYVREFEQPCHTRYGIKDLEWDGQLLWGSGDSSIYAFSTNGDLVHRFRGPYNPNTNIAYEPRRGVLWVSGTTTSIIACDFEGNVLDTLARKALRIYGLGWDAGDTDGYNLQILTLPGDVPPKIYKMNTETGDTILVTELTLLDGERGIEGLFVPPDNHRNGSASALFVRNIASNLGGDQLSEVILRPNLEWFDVSPLEGLLEPGAVSSVEAHIITRGELTDWMFEPGDYEAEVIITHDGREGEARVPIRLSVSPNYAPREAAPSAPVDFSFTAVYPQPFNSSLEISYRLNRASVVKLSLIDLAGREVAAIEEGYRPAGENRTTFDVIAIPSGIYMARLESGGAVAMVKAICLK